MQAFSAKTPQSFAAMFGTTAAAESNAADFATQFAAALQNGDETAFNPMHRWQLDGVKDISDIAAYQLVSDVDASEILPEKSYLGSPFTSPETQPGLSENDAEGIQGLQLVRLTGLELTSLIENGHIQSVDSINEQGPIDDNSMFVFAQVLGTDTSSHLIPVAKLDSIAHPEALTVVSTTLPPTPELPGAAPIPFAGSSNTPAEATVNTAAATAAGTTSAPQNTSASNNTGTAPGTSQLNSIPAGDDAVEAFATQQAKELAANGMNDAKRAEMAAHGKIDGKAAEGHVVPQSPQAAANNKSQAANQQKASNQGQQPSATVSSQAASQSGQASAAATATTKPETQSKPSSTSTSDKPGVRETSARKSAAHTQRAPISWTPERLAGLPENAVPAEAVAGGLTGLRSEPSFMNSMGLMGGKPSPLQGGQIAKQVNLQISRAVKNGSNEFNMRLNPTELGSVRVKMVFNESGRVSAQLFVERPETLELLQREMRGIERAVEAGGHKLDQGGLSFNLDTNDGQSAGKAFAEAAQQDRLKEKIEAGTATDPDGTSDDNFNNEDGLTDLAVLEKVLSRVSPDTGLDVRV